MRSYLYIISLFTAFSLSSCEDIIELDLVDAAPQVVIVADINDISLEHEISVFNSIPISQELGNSAVENASVSIVSLADNREYIFNYQGKGIYKNRGFHPEVGGKYALTVRIADKQFDAVSTMQPYVEIDSLNLKSKTIFDEDRIFVTFSFKDPANELNFYKYSLARNSQPLKFAAIYNDKFNDGRNIQHDITDADDDIVEGDDITIIRTSVDEQVYNYWADLRSLNPGSLAPANPRTNLSNGALGYFSVGAAKKYIIRNVAINRNSND
ncbi:DUF4249 domain-containing protein [Sphingobacteriaceae bacterium WQ 2009]|uniref:DUF4249 domain-containing protein n=1 Tax=Rhinopithecimicrobium faecis TaxID=2820698 RepID=A0A8T4H778_9SPHI|nr:DUF4249 domain-containing protein [Sphingobacteriaceae bacterium WQ 2009]